MSDYPMNASNPRVIAAVDTGICLNCLSTKFHDPKICEECGNCVDEPNTCGDSPWCAGRDPAYTGAEDMSRIAPMEAFAVVSTTPTAGALAFGPGGKVSVTFNREVNPNTVHSQSIYLVGPNGAGWPPSQKTSPALSVGNTVATLDFKHGLIGNTDYYLIVTTEVKDLWGNCLSTGYVMAEPFGIDSVAPEVASTSPANGASGVARAEPLTITFTRAMESNTITAESVKLVAVGGGAADVVATGAPEAVGWSKTVFTLQYPNLTKATVYKFYVSTAVTDMAGSAFEGAFTSVDGFTVTS